VQASAVVAHEALRVATRAEVDEARDAVPSVQLVHGG
jgi:hypothetical protein